MIKLCFINSDSTGSLRLRAIISYRLGLKNSLSEAALSKSSFFAVYFTTNSSVVVREADPDVPVTVMVYFPAGVPPVGGGVLLEPPQPAWNRIRAKNPPSKTPVRSSRLRNPPTLKPSNAMPHTGNHAAYSGAPDAPPGARLAVGFGRAVVLMFNARLCGPLFRLGMGLLVNAQAVAAGKPEVQDNDTLLGNAVVGVTVT